MSELYALAAVGAIGLASVARRGSRAVEPAVPGSGHLHTFAFSIPFAEHEEWRKTPGKRRQLRTALTVPSAKGGWAKLDESAAMRTTEVRVLADRVVGTIVVWLDERYASSPRAAAAVGRGHFLQFVRAADTGLDFGFQPTVEMTQRLGGVERVGGSPAVSDPPSAADVTDVAPPGRGYLHTFGFTFQARPVPGNWREVLLLALKVPRPRARGVTRTWEEWTTTVAFRTEDMTIVGDRVTGTIVIWTRHQSAKSEIQVARNMMLGVLSGLADFGEQSRIVGPAHEVEVFPRLGGTVRVP